MTSVVSTRALTKAYGRHVALAPLDLELGRGVTGFLGPNGAGKSTLLRILATAQAPSGGEVRVDGDDPATPGGRLAIRRRLGYVPQEVGLYETFTAFDFLDYLAILKEHVDRRARHDEVRRVLDEVDMAAHAKTRIRKLSGGMRRRIVVAQALLGDPSVLVLDEPTVGLDPEQRLRFRQVVSRRAESACVVLSTHMTEDVEALCDRVLVLDGGHVVFDGTPPQLAAVATGRVWVADQSDAQALMSWRSGDGRHRMVGDAPLGAELIAPTVQDGYLLLSGTAAAAVAP